MNTTIILTIVALLIFMKILSSLWKTGLKEADEYNKLALDPDYRAQQLQKLKSKLEAGNSEDSKLIYKIARINALAEDFEEAAKGFERYTALVPNDAEGFSELSDAYLGASKIDKAKEAIERAIEIEPKYEEYRELQLRLGLKTKDVEYAEKASVAWIELDEERVLLNKRPHRWSPEYQIGPKQATADIAIKSYLGAILVMKGEKDAAMEAIEAMDDKERDYLEILLEEDELFNELKEVYEA